MPTKNKLNLFNPQIKFRIFHLKTGSREFHIFSLCLPACRFWIQSKQP
ncbi:hypothetical protein SLEP1_g31770 [Rubroshorea leprosula]|uniref:Uncharacterized protein n=1 Tax=Rubroshorea leprosula TaxID=152421 RepID=A0AAV5K4C2_9ROSI|nr:hypothetical protein SLEP1_g31770 [Rubroshorea leprosula]